MNTTSAVKSNYAFSIFILGTLFFIFGFVTWLNGTLIPYLKIVCEKSNFESFFVTFAFYIAYFCLALPSSWILKKIGFKNGMALGLFIMALGAILFVPAANSRSYNIFLIGLFIIGTGLALLQTASNPYITILGPIESAAKRISLMGIGNKVAGILGILILSSLLFSDADKLKTELPLLSEELKIEKLNALASLIIPFYITVSIILFLLAIVIKKSNLPEIGEVDQTTTVQKIEISKKYIIQFPQLILGVFAIFFYVGVEVLSIDSILKYGESSGFTYSVSKYFPAYALSAMLIGYSIGIILIPKYIKQNKALVVSAVAGILFSLIAITTTGYTSVMFIALLGLANALMWPAIWPLALEGLGKFTKTGSALLIMAIAGGALIPPLYGRLADISSIGPQKAYFIMIPCYLFILYYSLKGHKVR